MSRSMSDRGVLGVNVVLNYRFGLSIRPVRG